MVQRSRARSDVHKRPQSLPPVEICASCGLEHPCYNLTLVESGRGQSQKLCSFCFNSWMAQDLDVPMPDPCEFPPAMLKDGTGRSHTFYFDLKLEDSGVFLVAFEWVNEGIGGYQFAVLEKFDVKSSEIYEKLILKIKSAMAQLYLDRQAIVTRGDAVNGVFVATNPETNAEEPGVMVDGRFLKWDEFSHYFRDWTGHQFRIECADISEDMPTEIQLLPAAESEVRPAPLDGMVDIGFSHEDMPNLKDLVH